MLVSLCNMIFNNNNTIRQQSLESYSTEIILTKQQNIIIVIHIIHIIHIHIIIQTLQFFNIFLKNLKKACY